MGVDPGNGNDRSVVMVFKVAEDGHITILESYTKISSPFESERQASIKSMIEKISRNYTDIKILTPIQ